MTTKRADELQLGDVIDWRGQPATVVEVWTSPEQADKGIPEPVGCVIEFTNDGGAGEQVRCRLVWPESDAVTLEDDLVARPLTIWE